jgi:hypothetical protein
MPDLGDTLPFRSDLYDKPPAEGGVLTNATTAALTITLPDLTELAPAPTIQNPAAVTGRYLYDYTTTPTTAGGGGAGRYRGNWLFTMPTGRTTAYVEEFDVRETDPGYLGSLASLKDHLNIPATDTTHDEELRDWSESVTRLVEDRCGPVVQRTYTERHESGWSLWLRHPPVLSLTSVEPWTSIGISHAVTDLRFTEGGRVERRDATPLWGGPFEVVYRAGRVVTPPNLRDAWKIILKHLWETQRGAGGLPLQALDETSVVPGYAFAVPNRALELMSPDVRLPDMA